MFISSRPTSITERFATQGVIVEFLAHVIRHLEQQSYADDGRGLSMQQWFKTVENAREKVMEAKSRVQNPPVILVVDLDALERRAIAASIPDSDVIGLLPYQAGVSLGSTHFHIVNNSLYDVTTNAHVIPQGETICARGINTGDNDNSVQLLGVIPTCPGCLAKAKNQIAFHLQQQAQAGRLL